MNTYNDTIDRVHVSRGTPTPILRNLEKHKIITTLLTIALYGWPYIIYFIFKAVWID